MPAAAGALLVIAGLHLLPDAWGGAYAVRLWPPLVPIAAMGAFTAAGVAARTGCGCRPHTEQAGGAGAAAALALHRFLEGPPLHGRPQQRSWGHWPCTRSPRAWPWGHCSAPSHVAWRAGWRP